MSRAPLGGVREHQSSSNISLYAQSMAMGLFPASSFLFLQQVQMKGFNAAGASCSQSDYCMCYLSVLLLNNPI